MLQNKKILLGITGSIAAYKTAILTRLLVKAGAEVKIVMTSSAKDFVTPLSLSTLSKNPVLASKQEEYKIPLTQGMFAIVDEDDFEILSKFKWYAAKDCATYYAIRQQTEKGKEVTVRIRSLQFLFL